MLFLIGFLWLRFVESAMPVTRGGLVDDIGIRLVLRSGLLLVERSNAGEISVIQSSLLDLPG